MSHHTAEQENDDALQPPPPPDAFISGEEGRKYWEGVEADVGGMLGGFPHVSSVDLNGSRAFLARFGFGTGKKGLRKARRILEGGAGIGRVTRGLLTDVSNVVDVVEPVAKFSTALEGQPGVGRIYSIGLEEWEPEPEPRAMYDVVWNQWCVGHLTDAQLVQYLRRCVAALVPDDQHGCGGLIVVKENLSRGDEDEFDGLDNSVTRSGGKFKDIFRQAGLHIVHKQLQCGLPRGLYRVMMYALKPIKDTSLNKSNSNDSATSMLAA